MNELIQTPNTPITMSSLELVEFINSQRAEGGAVLAHSDFLKKVLLVLGELGAGKFSCTYRDVQNKERPCYTLPKREACLMAMSYSYELQAKVFDRMTALEAQTPALNPVNFSRLQLIELAMQAEQERLMSDAKVQELTVTVQQQAPKVAALDRISRSDGSLCVTDAAKTLQVQPRALTKLLQENGWVYRRPMGSGWLAYQERIQSGLLEHKVTTGEKSNGDDWTSTQVRITPKGLTKLASVIAQAGVQ